jgi:hypothetical protein
MWAEENELMFKDEIMNHHQSMNPPDKYLLARNAVLHAKWKLQGDEVHSEWEKKALLVYLEEMEEWKSRTKWTSSPVHFARYVSRSMPKQMTNLNYI